MCSLARTISICRAGAAIRRELPTSHKPVRFLRPPLRGTARRGRRALRSVDCTLAVGRDHWARRCRNCQICTNLFVFTVRRCAERMGHAPSLHFYVDFLLFGARKSAEIGPYGPISVKNHVIRHNRAAFRRLRYFLPLNFPAAACTPCPISSSTAAAASSITPESAASSVFVKLDSTQSARS